MFRDSTLLHLAFLITFHHLGDGIVVHGWERDGCSNFQVAPARWPNNIKMAAGSDRKGIDKSNGLINQPYVVRQKKTVTSFPISR